MLRRTLSFGASFLVHLTVSLFLLVTTRASLFQSHATAKRERPIEVVVVPAPEAESLPGLKSLDGVPTDALGPVDGESTAVSLPGFTFDFRKIADRGPLLFPFLTPGLSLEHFGLTGKYVRVSLRNPFTVPRDDRSGNEARPPLVLSEDALQAVIDKSWSRRDRWDAFQDMVTLTTRYSPDEGQLPAAIQEYVRQNALQPYADTAVRDHRLWAQLGVAADHADFVGLISRYVSAHPSTRTATELLLLLDRLAQANLDDLVTLLDVTPNEDLGWTRKANPSAYEFIVQAQRHYRGALERMGVTSADELKARYDRVRLAILDGVLDTTPHGYRSSDARFLIGAIYWGQRNRAAALESWRAMTIDPTDGHATEIAELLAALDGASDNQTPVGRIDQILSNVVGRWRSLSHDRLKQFGYRFDTY